MGPAVFACSHLATLFGTIVIVIYIPPFISTIGIHEISKLRMMSVRADIWLNTEEFSG